MRKIKFRGKKINKEKWVYGSLLVANSKVYIYPDNYADLEDIDFGNGFIEVIPKTVGQYIHLYDTNNYEICEGDIVKQTVSGYIYVVTYNYDWGGYEPFFSGYENYKVYKIIGNVYDNPELLKEV